MKFNVTAVSINRHTREQIAPPRVELIDTDTNAMFSKARTSLGVEISYEAFWNMNPRSTEVVKVIGVVAIAAQETSERVN